MVSEEITLQNVRNRVLNISLVVSSFACFPALLGSIARVRDIGWQPVMTWQVLVALMLWCLTIWRHVIPFQTRTLLLLCSLFFLGVIVFWSFGLIGGAIWFFCSTNVLASILFGSRWGWITSGATVLAMSATSFAIINGYIEYPFDMNAFAASPSTLLSTVLTAALFLSALTVCLGTFHMSLIEIIKRSNTQATKLATEVEERKNAETKTRESENRFRKIIENITDVYFETDFVGTIVYCSPSCVDLSGYTQKELIGKNATMLYKDPQDRQLLLDAIQQKGVARNLELVFKKKNGESYDVSFNANLFLDENKNPVGMHGTIREITTMKRIKEQMERAKKMEAIGLMAGGVAHDLNNILSGVVSYPDLLLLKVPEDSELRAPLETIRESGKRAALVVADLLTVAKSSASTRESCDLHSLIMEYLNSPEHAKTRELYPQITYRQNFLPTNPTLNCSPVHIKKCIMNLLNNAAEAIPADGTILLSTSNYSADDTFSVAHNVRRGEYVVLSILDTGAGISDHDLEHIFEPFYSRKIMGRSGTGLGLAIVWNTVKEHGGTILIESNPAGTRFDLYFPSLTQSKGLPLHQDDPETTLQGKDEHILIVDDEVNLREIAVSILTEHGYHAVAVSSGEKAIDYLLENSVHLVVLDMLMDPGMDGRTTYEKILTLSANQKAIVASGFSESLDVKAMFKLGVGGFISKPYSVEQLCQAVRKELDR